jgi:hypothetical protein
MVDSIGTQIFSCMFLKTRFWFGEQVANKHTEAPHFIEGRVVRVKSVFSHPCPYFPQATPTPLQICKIEDGIA